MDDLSKPLLDDENKDADDEIHSISRIYKEISKITFPAIVCQFCLMMPNTINIWAAGQLNSALLMDVVGLGMGITSSIGMAIFLGLNGALYTFLS